MGVDAKLMLPGAVRVSDVVNVIAASVGVDVKLLPLGGGSIYASQNSVVARSYSTDSLVHCAEIVGPGFSVMYHFECEGGYRLLMSRSTPFWIAVLRKVGEFFGGFLVWQDSDEVGEYFHSPDLIVASNGKEWDLFQHRLAAVPPITLDDLEDAEKAAAYQDVQYFGVPESCDIYQQLRESNAN